MINTAYITDGICDSGTKTRSDVCYVPMTEEVAVCFHRIIAMADKPTGYTVHDWNGKAVYGAEVSGGSNGITNADCPFMVKVRIDDLNIRKGAGTNTANTGKYTGKGVFNIMEVREGKGLDKEWGRLKSEQDGLVWIIARRCKRIGMVLSLQVLGEII